VYHGSPPCQSCGKPRDLFANNRTALFLWSILHDLRTFQVGLSEMVYNNISISDTLDLCREYDATRLDFMKILRVEKVILPMINSKLSGK